jgi:hypothetical protein
LGRDYQFFEERGQEIAKIVLSVDNTLKKISSNCKKKWGNRIPLPITNSTLKIFPSCAIEKH